MASANQLLEELDGVMKELDIAQESLDWANVTGDGSYGGMRGSALSDEEVLNLKFTILSLSCHLEVLRIQIDELT
jgi:hypothetical protein